LADFYSKLRVLCKNKASHGTVLEGKNIYTQAGVY
jgi:hypothetical protein